MVRALALVSSLLMSFGVAHADEPRVAIVPGIAVNLDTARVDALSQDLAEALSQELVVDAIGGLEVRRLLPAEGLPPDCVTTPACTTEVGKRTKATQLLFIVMVDSGAGGTIQVDSTWVEPGKPQTISRPAIDLTSASEAKTKFASSAHQLLPDAKVREKQTVGGGGGAVGVTKMAPATPRHLTLASTVTAVGTAIAVGSWIGFGVSTISAFNKCKGNVPACTDDDMQAIRTRALVADISSGIAAGAAIATVILYVTSAKEPHVIVEPAGPGAAISWHGRF